MLKQFKIVEQRCITPTCGYSNCKDSKHWYKAEIREVTQPDVIIDVLGGIATIRENPKRLNVLIVDHNKC